MSSAGRTRRRCSRQSSQRRRGDRLKRLGLADRDVGQHLAVEIEPGELYAVHELRISEAVLARAGIDPLDPQRTKVALAVTPVAVGIAQRLLDLFDGHAIGSAAATAVAPSEVEDLLVTGVGRNPAFDARHSSPPQIRHVSQDQLGVPLLHGRGAAPQSLALRRFADQPVAFVTPVPNDLPGGGAAKALLRTALCLELGHPNIRIKHAAPRYAFETRPTAHSSRAI